MARLTNGKSLKHGWISTLCLVKETRHKRVHTMQFHLYQNQDQEYQNILHLQRMKYLEREYKGTFWGWGKSSMYCLTWWFHSFIRAQTHWIIDVLPFIVLYITNSIFKTNPILLCPSSSNPLAKLLERITHILCLHLLTCNHFSSTWNLASSLSLLKHFWPRSLLCF